MYKSFNRNLLDLSAHLRRDKKISTEDLKNISFYIKGYDRNDSDIIKVNRGEHLVLHGACLYYGMSNDFRGFTEVLEESVISKSKRNTYISIPDYDRKNYIIETSEGYFVPTEARCIIDCIRYKDISFNLEGLLLAINDYFDLDKTVDELYEVGNFFGVSKADIDYWIKEADKVNYEI